MDRAVHIFNSLITGVFDILFIPLAFLGPFWSLTAFSLATGLLMLFVYGLVSDQKGIRKAKDRIQAGLIATPLFQNDLGVFFRVQGRIALDTLIYLKHSLKPMLFMIAPVVLILVQLNGRYGVRPLEIGESALVKVKVADSGLLEGAAGLRLQAEEGVEVETPAVRIPSQEEVAWRVRPRRAGEFLLTIVIGEEEVRKTLIAGKPGGLVSQVRTGEGLLSLILYPGEAPLSSSLARSVRVDYPQADIALAGWNINWLVYFFVFSVLSGYLLKGLFRIEV